MLNEQTDTDAKLLWEYLKLHQTPVKSDIILCLCSHDTRVAGRASQLMLDGLGGYLVFSGGVGKLTKDLFTRPEAEVFADIAQKMGVPGDKIIIESKSTNTGENIRFTYDLLRTKGIAVTTILLVQKPNMERRTYATFKKQWPGAKVSIAVTSPQLSYDEYMQGSIGKEHIINVMVGDLQRIREYPRLGFQIAQEIPDEVWKAYERLIAQGFTEHLITK